MIEKNYPDKYLEFLDCVLNLIEQEYEMYEQYFVDKMSIIELSECIAFTNKIVHSDTIYIWYKIDKILGQIEWTKK